MKFRLLYLACALCFIGCIYGCSKPANETPQGLSTEVEDADTGVIIRVHLADDTIDIADRAQVQVSVEWVSPVSVEFIDPDFETRGWVVVTKHATPQRFANGVYSLDRSYTIEPFLPGEYEIPPFAVSVKPKSGADSVEFKSKPISVAVEPGIETNDVQDSDAQALEPSFGMIDASVFNSGNSTGFNVSMFTASMVAVLVFLLLGLLIWLVYGERGKLASPPSVNTLLQEIVDRSDEEETGRYHDLHQALLLLDTRLLSTSEINGFVQECERAEFSNRAEATMSSGLMAQHTLDILGQWEEGDA